MIRIFSYAVLFFIFNISLNERSFAEGPSFNTRKERTGMSSAGWGLQNEKSIDVDLSEWGGERPSCSIAPDCPVCIQ
tara:strand:- start:48 stop:278 length:231 start_codon:yes stop_codon:yes gene_type:complete